MNIDLNKRIIYQNDEGGVSVIIPCDCGLTIEEIAAKDVPPLRTFIPNSTDEETGEQYPNGQMTVSHRPYKIVDVSEIPSDRSERMAWTVDASDLTDGVGE